MVRCFFQRRNFPWLGKGKNKYFSLDESVTGAPFQHPSRWKWTLERPGELREAVTQTLCGSVHGEKPERFLKAVMPACGSGSVCG